MGRRIERLQKLMVESHKRLWRLQTRAAWEKHKRIVVKLEKAEGR